MSSLREVSNNLAQQARKQKVASLKQRVQQAISWGVPDSESIGLQPYQFTSLLRELLSYCEELEGKVK